MKNLEQLKSEAREKAVWCGGLQNVKAIKLSDIETLVTTAYKAGIERAVEVVAELGQCMASNSEFNLGYEAALEDITTTLQAEVNKDKI